MSSVCNRWRKREDRQSQTDLERRRPQAARHWDLRIRSVARWVTPVAGGGFAITGPVHGAVDAGGTILFASRKSVFALIKPGMCVSELLRSQPARSPFCIRASVRSGFHRSRGRIVQGYLRGSRRCTRSRDGNHRVSLQCRRSGRTSLRPWQGAFGFDGSGSRLAPIAGGEPTTVRQVLGARLVGDHYLVDATAKMCLSSILPAVGCSLSLARVNGRVLIGGFDTVTELDSVGCDDP